MTLKEKIKKKKLFPVNLFSSDATHSADTHYNGGLFTIARPRVTKTRRKKALNKGSGVGCTPSLKGSFRSGPVRPPGITPN